jgi:hypothetical protein
MVTMSLLSDATIIFNGGVTEKSACEGSIFNPHNQVNNHNFSRVPRTDSSTLMILEGSAGTLQD